MITQTVGELLQNHVRLEIDCIDSLYLNAYQPILQSGGGVAYFFKQYRGEQVASTKLMAPMSHDFIKRIDGFAREQGVDLVRFRKDIPKDDFTRARLQDLQRTGGILYIGVAQERFSTFRMAKRLNVETAMAFPRLGRSTVICHQYYFYLVDKDSGPMFIKFSNYFAYTTRICLNGNLDKRGVGFALDNGLLSCEQPREAKKLAVGLGERKIDRVVRKWFARLPYPFTAKDRQPGFRYELSILQAEFTCTQLFDRPLSGRYFFEQVIRESLVLGRPSQVSLIFDWRVIKSTPGIFPTLVVTKGVLPSPHFSYKNSKIKQCFKKDRALLTETTINNSRDFGVGKKLKKLLVLRKIGFTANRLLLEVETLSQDCRVGEAIFEQVTRRCAVEGQTTSALKFGDPQVMALLHALILFGLLQQGFSNTLLREHVVHLMGKKPDQWRGQTTYHLRRLRLHGLIERIPSAQRNRVTTEWLFSKVHSRLLRSDLPQLINQTGTAATRPLGAAINKVQRIIDDQIEYAKIAA